MQLGDKKIYLKLIMQQCQKTELYDNEIANRIIEKNINLLTDQLVKLTIGQGKEYKKVLFFADTHFLFLIPYAHLANCLLPNNS